MRLVRRPPGLDATERVLLEALLVRALPPHHALFRTAHEWYVYRWSVDKMAFVPYLSGSDLAHLLARLQVRDH
jgi:hypothetical protein